MTNVTTVICPPFSPERAPSFILPLPPSGALSAPRGGCSHIVLWPARSRSTNYLMLAPTFDNRDPEYQKAYGTFSIVSERRCRLRNAVQ